VTAPQTRYGSPRRPVRIATAVLRARAAANGARLRDTDELNLATAAVGADAWVALTGAQDLSTPAGFGPAATASLAAILARAAGHPGQQVEVPLETCASSMPLLRLAEEHVDWAYELVGTDAHQALIDAGSDLAAGGPDSAFAAYGCLLQVVAGEVARPASGGTGSPTVNTSH